MLGHSDLVKVLVDKGSDKEAKNIVSHVTSFDIISYHIMCNIWSFMSCHIISFIAGYLII
jgi:hypothetical protein